MTAGAINVADVHLDRLWAKIDTTGPCWEWTASLRPNGYGQFNVNGRTTRAAHRVVYAVLVGDVSGDLDLDHLCRNRKCVNPDHLEPVTRQENLRRGQGLVGENHRKTHCKRGHEFTPANIYWVAGKGHRHCKTCINEQQRAAYAKKRERGELAWQNR